MEVKTQNKAKPFLRWAGGKRWLVDELIKIIPADIKNYYEPFLGAGSLYFNIDVNKAYLSDINSDLILTYKMIKKDYKQVLYHLNNFKNSKKNYYIVREKEFKNEFKKAARFIYLNKTCWNGLYRENSSGKFNVPYGNKKHTEIFNEENLEAVNLKLKNAHLYDYDFEYALRNCEEGDLIYLDPPYTVAHQNNGFIKYNSKIFSWSDQKRLSKLMKSLNDKGCYLILSNASHESILLLYDGFNFINITRHSIIGAKSDSRKKIKEYLITNF